MPEEVRQALQAARPLFRDEHGGPDAALDLRRATPRVQENVATEGHDLAGERRGRRGAQERRHARREQLGPQLLPAVLRELATDRFA